MGRGRQRRGKKVVSGRCEVCGEEKPFCWRCRQCGYLICQECMMTFPRRFSCNSITWVCPNCLNWEVL
ncbi:hypothetical protein G4V39_08080 [Thermosulfuriphilus ammonigenes]|uniref:Uncharacterized protein n=1 Tax=Thermosulfuriphilus ammonigenes TaxID=1936021 RepID=A0A6G7PX89_9BACT|nr:hypothetical protein [Thermosulfuriphilus ammonigenes]MBA2849673.1 late competence protein required for DNA uptake (superfamily II DNA/RNA helicase) [Thermosulfuriphilus ammonigenes]QIJ72230.1 hypothetical protein G4V39_08080 [Thermosulfuriphilus ammonigenes]